MDPEEREACIFYCTKKPEHFEDNVLGGIWPRYCGEDFDWLFERRTYLAFPVVCFTAMPARDFNDHKGRYGYYAVAIRKDRASAYGIRLMEYVEPESETAKRYISQIGEQRSRVKIANVEPELKEKLPFLKSTAGAQGSRLFDPVTGVDLPVQRFDANEVLAFDDEQEWRFTPPELDGQWEVGMLQYSLDPKGTRELTMNIGLDLDKLSERSRSHRLHIAEDDIVALFVPAEVVATFQAKAPFQHLKDKICTWPS